MTRFLKRSLVFLLISYGVLYYILQINFFSFNLFYFDDSKKKDQNYFFKLFSFLSENNLKKAFVLRDGEFLTYSDLKIHYLFDDKTVDLVKDESKIYDFDCIISNNYSDPIIYNSYLKDVLNKYEKSTLVFDDLGYKVFGLNKNSHQVNTEKFKFNVSQTDCLNQHYLYLTHQNEYPSFLVKPDVKYNEFPILEDGSYDCICDMEIMAEEDSMVLFSIINYESFKNEFILKDTFYLKKGKNNISTRFLSTNQPFRCLFSSKKRSIIVSDFKIKFFKQENKTFNLKQLYPKTYSMAVDNNIINFNSMFFIENKEDKEKLIKLNLSGDGELFLTKLKLNVFNKKLLKLNFFNAFFIKILSLIEGDNSVVAIGQKSKTIEKNIPPNSILFLQFKKNHMNENANFVIQDIKIINGREND
ncbi:MAG: hypothetical protein Q8L85_01870 [Alphaproteobacteria bacterium]|nr:hypothetical protein [Alphaproteobacteria bacterium]